MHSNIGFRTWCWAYSSGNIERKDNIFKRKVQPLWYTKVMCWRVPWTEWYSLQDTLPSALDRNTVTLARYLMHFLHDREME